MILAARTATGQSSATRSVALDTLAQRALTRVKKSLRDLVTAEEMYFSDHQRYTKDLTAVWASAAHYHLQKPDTDVSLSVTHAGRRAWRGTARTRRLPGSSCVLFVGPVADFPMPSTARSGLVPETDEEGVPVCDSL